MIKTLKGKQASDFLKRIKNYGVVLAETIPLRRCSMWIRRYKWTALVSVYRDGKVCVSDWNPFFDVQETQTTVEGIVRYTFTDEPNKQKPLRHFE